MSTTGCRNLRDYLAHQREHLRQAIDENKWYLSERQGRDVGPATAKVDFIENHFDRVAHDFRVRFCGADCIRRAQCPVADGVHHIPPSRGRG
ncbi:MAG: hypothetical protein FJ221_11180 [Lentisphaerae bacterium]|nr:hypothetical protein [Lentisphaerota bacterium]